MRSIESEIPRQALTPHPYPSHAASEQHLTDSHHESRSMTAFKVVCLVLPVHAAFACTPTKIGVIYLTLECLFLRHRVQLKISKIAKVQAAVNNNYNTFPTIYFVHSPLRG